MAKNYLSESELESIVEDVYDACNGNIPLQFVIRDHQEDFYGPEGSTENIGKVEGAYYPRRGEVLLVRGHLYSHSGGRRAVCHEVLGHYGLNTLEPGQKRHLLEHIAQSRDEPSLQEHWRKVDDQYTNAPELLKAEEIFAFVAENEPQIDREKRPTLGPLTLERLEQIAAHVAEGIRQGEKQKTFPKTDREQFRGKARDEGLEL